MTFFYSRQHPQALPLLQNSQLDDKKAKKTGTQGHGGFSQDPDRHHLLPNPVCCLLSFGREGPKLKEDNASFQREGGPRFLSESNS